MSAHDKSTYWGLGGLGRGLLALLLSAVGLGVLGVTSALAWPIDEAHLGQGPDLPAACSPAVMVTSTVDSGAGSLRQALVDVCADGTITFDAGLTGQTIVLTTTEIPVTQTNLLIDGSNAPGVKVDGNQAHRVFNVSAPLSVKSLIIQHGYIVGDGGGLWTNQPLTLTNVSFLTNTASGAGGGLIDNSTAVMTNVAFISNTAQSWIAGGAYVGGDVTIDGGRFERNTSYYLGGGLETNGNVVLTDVIFITNTTLTGGGGGAIIGGTATINGGLFQANTVVSTTSGVGGGLYVYNALHLNGTQFRANTAGTSAGGLQASSTAVLTDVTFINNTAVSGSSGGAYIDGAATIKGGLFQANTAQTFAGGLQANSTTVMTNVTFISNTASTGDGGGARINAAATINGGLFQGNTATDGGGISNYGTLTVINSTLSGNSASSGGGIYAANTLTVINSTLSGNLASSTGGGGISQLAGTASLANTLVAGNTSAANKPDLSGAFTSSGYNLIGSVDGSTGLTNGVNGDIAGTNAAPLPALLGALANNGGSTWTMALLPGSPAINAGNNATCPVVDQRGVERIGTCDIGAFESRGFTLTKISGDNQMTPRSATFAAPLIATISSAFGEPVNGGRVTFVGPFSGAGLAPITTTIAIASGAASASVTANNSGGAYTVTASANGATSAIAYTDLINNSAPVLTPIGDQVTPEDVTRGPLMLGLSDADSPIGDLILAAVSGNPALIPTGNIVFGWSGQNRTLALTPLLNQFGSATITFTVSDAFTSTPRVFNFNVTPVNDAPTAVNLSNTTVAENQPAGTGVGTLSAVDVEPGDTHTFALIAGAGDADNASFQIVANALQTKAVFDYEARTAYSIRLRATDNGGLSVEQTYTITILNANDAPIAQPDYATTTAGQNVSVAVLANDSDPDGNPLQLTGVSTPVSGTTSLNGSSVLYTPPTAWVGTTTFTYTVSDGQDGMASALVTVLINPPSAPDVIIRPDVVTTTEDTPLVISPLANDSAPQALSLIYVGPSSGGAAELLGTQALFAPALNFNGVTTFTYGALAGTAGGGQAIVTVNILPVNDPPGAASDSASTPEETAVAINVLANDVDMDGNPLTLVSVDQGGHGLVQFANAGAGVVTYTPHAGYHGPDQFAYDISDGQGGTASGVVNVTVLEVNRAPLAARDAVLADEDTTVVINVLANDTDPNTNDSLQVIAVTQAQSGTVTLLPSGRVQYVPDADYYGSDNFAYFIADSSGLTGTASVGLTIRPVLDPPVPNPVASATSLNTPFSLNVLSATVNADGQSIIVSSYTQPPSGTVTLNPDGTFLFTPTVGFEGLTEFTYTLGISGTGFNAVRTGSAPMADRAARVTVAVGNVTDTATIADNAVELTAGSRIEINPLANVQCQASTAPVQAPAGLANLVLIGLQRRIGLAAANANGTVTFTPPPGFSGTDTITYTVSDGAGCFGSGVVDLTVAAAPRPPNALDDLVAGTEDTPLTINVKANDYDLAGGPITVTAVSQPGHGQATLKANGTVAYTPTLNFNGIDRLAYTLVNQHGIEGVASVYVVIANVNDAPIVRDDSAVAQEDTSTVIAVRANDTDPDGDILVVTAGQPLHGTVSVTPLDTLFYRPALNFNGTDVLTYTVNDNHGGLATATLTITVAPVNDPPVAITDTATITGGQLIQINVLANDSDVDSAQLLVTGVSASSGTAAIEGNVVWYTPVSGTARTDTLTYSVADEQGGQATGTIVVTVLETPAVVTEYHIYLPLVRR